MLSEEDMKGNLYRIAKQLVRNNNAVVGSGSVKDRDGNIAVDDSRIKEVWKEYFEKLLNEEFEWDKELLEDASPTSGPAERITEEEVRVALAKTKVGKAAGPTGLVSEMLTASGETGVSWLTDLFNAIVKEGNIPADLKKSWMVSVYKGKGDALDCGSYRGIKLLDQVMKVFERVIERKMRNLVSLDDMQFGAFVDLEKAFDRVPRDVLWWALRQSGVDEWIVPVIQSMYKGALHGWSSSRVCIVTVTVHNRTGSSFNEIQDWIAMGTDLY